MQIEKYIADKITSLCEKRNISKYRLSQLSGISQSSLGRIMAQENLPSLITLEKILAINFASIHSHYRKYTDKKYKDTFVSAKVIFAYIIFIITQTVMFVT